MLSNSMKFVRFAGWGQFLAVLFLETSRNHGIPPTPVGRITLVVSLLAAVGIHAFSKIGDKQ